MPARDRISDLYPSYFREASSCSYRRPSFKRKAQPRARDCLRTNGVGAPLLTMGLLLTGMKQPLLHIRFFSRANSDEVVVTLGKKWKKKKAVKISRERGKGLRRILAHISLAAMGIKGQMRCWVLPDIYGSQILQVSHHKISMHAVEGTHKRKISL